MVIEIPADEVKSVLSLGPIGQRQRSCDGRNVHQRSIAETFRSLLRWGSAVQFRWRSGYNLASALEDE